MTHPAGTNPGARMHASEHSRAESELHINLDMQPSTINRPSLARSHALRALLLAARQHAYACIQPPLAPGASDVTRQHWS